MVKVEQYKAGSVIFHEGTKGNALYRISDPVDAKVNIVKDYDSPQSTTLATLTANQQFGEMGVITGEPRNATAVAKTDVTLEVITRDDLLEYCKDHPELLMELLSDSSVKLRNLTCNYVSAIAALGKYKKEIDSDGKASTETIKNLKKYAK